MKMRLLTRLALGAAMLGAVAASDARGQGDLGTGAPGIASFQQVTLRSSVPLVALVSFVSLVLGLAVMFTGRPARTPTPLHQESGLHRTQRTMALASAPTQEARRSIAR